jgi:hypothetical protein
MRLRMRPPAIAVAVCAAMLVAMGVTSQAASALVTTPTILDATAYNATSGSSLDVPGTSGQVDDELVVTVSQPASNTTIAPPTDSLGDTFTEAVQVTAISVNGTKPRATATFITRVASTSANTVTVTYGGGKVDVVVAHLRPASGKHVVVDATDTSATVGGGSSGVSVSSPHANDAILVTALGVGYPDRIAATNSAWSCVDNDGNCASNGGMNDGNGLGTQNFYYNAGGPFFNQGATTGMTLHAYNQDGSLGVLWWAVNFVLFAEAAN